MPIQSSLLGTWGPFLLLPGREQKSKVLPVLNFDFLLTWPACPQAAGVSSEPALLELDCLFLPQSTFFFFFFWPRHGLWYLSSPTRDGTQAPAVKAPSPNHWTAREFPYLSQLLASHQTAQLRFHTPDDSIATLPQRFAILSPFTLPLPRQCFCYILVNRGCSSKSQF